MILPPVLMMLPFKVTVGAFGTPEKECHIWPPELSMDAP